MTARPGQSEAGRLGRHPAWMWLPRIAGESISGMALRHERKAPELVALPDDGSFSPMLKLALRFLGVGNAQSEHLGSSAAVLEVADRPFLLIDCGPTTLAAYQDYYSALPSALFITHAHLDHIGGLEGLFYRLATAEGPRSLVTLFVPVTLVGVLQRRLADYSCLLAEGGCNFWDPFRLIPVSEGFWHRGLYFSVFPVRHHEHLTAFGLVLAGSFLFTGDTRPIPEVLNRYARRGELIFHDCAVVSSPSHSSIDELRAEYSADQCKRMVLYHYESRHTGEQIERAGWRVAHCGERFSLEPRLPDPRLFAEPDQIDTLPGAIGWQSGAGDVEGSRC